LWRRALGNPLQKNAQGMTLCIFFWGANPFKHRVIREKSLAAANLKYELEVERRRQLSVQFLQI
jgi:hypothetical protein